jgi:hypothetical protein
VLCCVGRVGQPGLCLRQRGRQLIALGGRLLAGGARLREVALQRLALA